MKEQRANILQQVQNGTISIEDAETKLSEIFKQIVEKSIAGLHERQNRDATAAFNNFLEFNKISHSEGFFYAIGRIEKHWELK